MSTSPADDYFYCFSKTLNNMLFFYRFCIITYTFVNGFAKKYNTLDLWLGWAGWPGWAAGWAGLGWTGLS